MADTSLRMIQAFPDAASAQLRLCEGLESILRVIDQRLAQINVVLEQRRLESKRVVELAGLVSTLATGANPGRETLDALAAELIEEAVQAAALRFYVARRPATANGETAPDSTYPARHVACHGLTVAGVVARLVRHDPELRSRPRKQCWQP